MTDLVDASARLLRQDAPGLAGHLALHGTLPGLTGPQVIAAVEQAGLTGRGGAALPTGRKLGTVASAAGRRGSVVVANGCEGEPASHKDKALMLAAPHLVLDGLELAARAVGAAGAHLCIHQDAHDIRAALTTALAERPGDAVPVLLAAVPHCYVASEATALVRALNGGPSLPTYTPPHPFERGVAARPTLVDNVETLAHLALICRYGPGWFRSAGSADAPGTALVTVTGAVRTPGVYEIPLGLTGSDLLLRAGGAAEPVQALLCGGYGGAWLGITEFESARLSAPGLASVRSTFGAGVFVALPQRACALAETARNYLAAQSAGQCGPCRSGLPALAQALHVLLDGGDARTVGNLETLLPYADRRGACAHPTGAARMIGSALQVFAGEVRAHADRGTCPRRHTPEYRTSPRAEVRIMTKRDRRAAEVSDLAPAHALTDLSIRTIARWLLRDDASAIPLGPSDPAILAATPEGLWLPDNAQATDDSEAVDALVSETGGFRLEIAEELLPGRWASISSLCVLPQAHMQHAGIRLR